MKLLRREANKDGSGSVRLLCAEQEDMWHLYNLVAVGDLVTASTFRRVQRSTDGGSTSSDRVRLTLCVRVEHVDYDAVSGIIHLNGRVAEENPHVKMGAFHTVDLEVHRAFTLFKEEWDSVSSARLEEVMAVVIQEGVAHVCLVTGSMTIVAARIDMPIPRKRRGSVASHEKAMTRFLDAVMSAILRHADFSVVKAVVIAGPGFTKDQLWDFMTAEANKKEIRPLLENRSKFVLCHASSGHKAAGEVRALNAFYEMLNSEPDRAVYGLGHVSAAAEALAVQTLMISDELFRRLPSHLAAFKHGTDSDLWGAQRRAEDPAKRRTYVRLADSVKAAGGEALIFSSLHVTGEQLGQLTGVAALLRFPMPELDAQVEEDSEDDDDEDGGGGGGGSVGAAGAGEAASKGEGGGERRREGGAAAASDA